MHLKQVKFEIHHGYTLQWIQLLPLNYWFFICYKEQLERLIKFPSQKDLKKSVYTPLILAGKIICQWNKYYCLLK